MAFRLLRMQPDQIPIGWGFIRKAMQVATAGGFDPTEESLANLLQALMAGRIDSWVFYKQRDEEEGKVLGLMLTTITEDTIAQIKHMLIYSMSGFNYIDDEKWMIAFTTLAKYARAKGCSTIRAVTNNDRVLDVAAKIGAEIVGYTIEVEV